MKKTLHLLLILALLGAALCLAACDPNGICVHSWANATCTTPRQCSLCNATMGEPTGHAYGEWSFNGDGTHTRVCANDKDHSQTEKCTAAEAAEGQDKICGVCNGVLEKAPEYTYGPWTSNGDGTHTRVCNENAEITVTEKCNGGKATCTSLAICADCGDGYGAPLPHTYDKKIVEDVYEKSPATCLTKSLYYYSCVCGAKGEDTFEHGEALGHSFGAWASNGNGTHTRICANDASHTETNSCNGGKATCAEKAICEKCKSGYGDLLAHVYDKKIAEDVYEKSPATCLEMAYYYYSCVCGKKGENTFGVGEALGHLYGEWTKENGYTHKRTCLRDSSHTEQGECTLNTQNDDGEYICDVCKLVVELPYHLREKAPVVEYLRIAQIGNENVTIKFNVTGKNPFYEIRYSTSPITEESFNEATLAQGVTVTGLGTVKTAVLDLAVGKTDKYYIAVRVKSNGIKSNVEAIRAGGIDLVYVDPNRVNSIYCGEVIKDLTPLIDEYDIALNGALPINRLKKFYHKAGDWNEDRLEYYTDTDERYGTDLAPIIDLEYNHYIDYIMVFYSQDVYDLDVRTSKGFANFKTPSAWDATNETYLATSFKPSSWNKIEIGKEVRFIQLQFLDGEAPVEVVFYGYQTGETEGDELSDKTHKLPTIGEMMGACTILGDGAGSTVGELSFVNIVREYHNLGWSYNASSFPLKSTVFIKTVVGNFDKKYKEHAPYNLIIPCLQWGDGDNPARTYNKLTGKLNSEVATFTEKYLPSTYIGYADLVYQYAARYGSSRMGYLYENVRVHSDGGTEIGLNLIKWLEFGNEPNGEDQRGTTPYQLAALTSAAYDGHMRTLLADVYNPDDYTYFLGAKNADPDIKVAMAGLANIAGNDNNNYNYIAAMCYWMRANRYDKYGMWTTKNDAIAMDAFNVHKYFSKYEMYNGERVLVGVSPEEYGLVEAMSDLVEFRDKYYPDVEVWLTEFGWDTNESYETATSAHRYGEYTSRQVQAMWLTRAYLLLSSCGVDKATMYMVEDMGNDRSAYGRYGTCGAYGFTYRYGGDNPEIIYTVKGYDCYKGEPDSYGNNRYYFIDNDLLAGSYAEIKLTPKASYYYISTLYNTLNEFYFEKEVESGREDVTVFKFTNGQDDAISWLPKDEAKEAYALWCPTSNMTKVDGYKLYVGTDCNSVTLTETQVGYDEAGNTVAETSSQTGKQSTLTVDSEGYVYVNVSENPIYVVVDKK